jgi:YVTN family beta-propeller protein
VSVINGGAVTATIGVGSGPVGAGVDPSTHTVYVANESNNENTVSVINGAAVTATIGVGSQPDGVGVDPSTHTVYVADQDGNTVSVINGGAVTATIGVGNHPEGMGVDPSTHTAYVANTFGNSVSVVSRSPEVTSTGPADGSTGVSPNTSVYAGFDVAMDHASTARAFSLVRTSDGSPVAGSVSFLNDQLPTFTPSSPLAVATQYTAVISTVAMDTGGNHLGFARTWSFTTK